MSKYNSFEELKIACKKFVDAAKDRDAYDGIKKLLTELYPDKAHFIYELLQNAEDMHATEVLFSLKGEQLIFEHNGTRRDFTLDDISAITNVGQSPKRDDPTSIGQFGVGFKAVYAYTNTPEIHSGQYDFKILDMLLPEDIGVEKSAKPHFTQFIFPLGTAIKSTKQAIEEINAGLKGLDENSILFLSHIKKIRYILSDGQIGSVEIKPYKSISKVYEVTTYKAGIHTPTMSYFLKFEKPISVDIKNTTETRYVSIAYKVDINERSQLIFDSSIKGKVCIYFPAEKEVSNLRFHINAPFASTVARDSVRSCKENTELIHILANLVCESIDWIKANKLWDRSIYSVLPNKRDFMNDLNNVFLPIQRDIFNKLSLQDFIQAKNRIFYRAKDIVQLNGTIAKLFAIDELKKLEGHAHITAAQPNSFEYYLFLDLSILTINESKFLQILKNNHYAFYSIISTRGISWCIDFYSVMLEIWQHNNYDVGQLSKVKMIPADDGSFYSLSEKIFIKSNYVPKNIKSPKYVASALIKNEKAKRFLEDILKVPVMDSKYDYLEEINAGDIKGAISGIIDIIEEFSKANDKQKFYEKYKDAKIFISKNIYSDDPYVILPASQCCLNKSVAFFYSFERDAYKNTPCGRVFTGHKERVSYALMIEEYKKHYNSEVINQLQNMFIALGGKSKPAIYEFDVTNNPLCQQWISVNKYKKNNIQSRDFIISGSGYLDEIATKKLFAESMLLWRFILEEEVSYEDTYLYGLYQPNKCTYWTGESALVYYLKRIKWIPNKNGEYCRPCEITKEELPSEFILTEITPLLHAIGFGNKSLQSAEVLTKISDIAPDMTSDQQKALTLILENPALAETIVKDFKGKEGLSLLEALKKQTKMQKEPSDDDSCGQTATVKNPDKRKANLQKTFEAGLKSPFKRTKKLRYTCSSSNKEERNFVRLQYSGKCQICDGDAIIKHDGTPYFQAVNIVATSDLNDELLTNLELGWNTLSLCPNCAAKYLYCAKNLSNFVEQLESTNVEANSNKNIEIKIELQEEEVSIKFTPKHFLALKTAFEIYGKE